MYQESEKVSETSQSLFPGRQALSGIIFPQGTYNIFLLEKTAAHIEAKKYLRAQTEPTRKLSAKDFLMSFGKTARMMGENLKSYDDELSSALAHAISLKYGLNVKSCIGKNIRDVCVYIAENIVRERDTMNIELNVSKN